ncbi:hypothetical protein BS333_20170 [Vibrio azureus]|uniref:Uncharacterized protein n=1 Tax=Vibrio azureus NBRC 104587 TaxID=1219077 RepID=U3AVI4_9VIBR|nr:hypothetical protein [Vibrio azureus]AUI88622.1 hypothetical protein BS333_20170 [Vibrio azureus]GAD77242.1 hypothetical protein VAZ01S_067_00010 [Vibrio azureus NBRC 104587]
MNVKVMLVSLLCTGLISACGDGEDSSSVTPVPKSLPNTESLVAARDFDFDIGTKITLSMNYKGENDGALHIYSEAAYTDSSGDAIGDPRSRLTTVYPKLTEQIELEINTNWQQLYVHWVPMNVNESEQNWVISLNQANNTYHIDM